MCTTATNTQKGSLYESMVVMMIMMMMQMTIFIFLANEDSLRVYEARYLRLHLKHCL